MISTQKILEQIEYLHAVIENQQKKMRRMMRKVNRLHCSINPDHYKMGRHGNKIIWKFNFGVEAR